MSITSNELTAQVCIDDKHQILEVIGRVAGRGIDLERRISPGTRGRQPGVNVYEKVISKFGNGEGELIDIPTGPWSVFHHHILIPSVVSSRA